LLLLRHRQVRRGRRPGRRRQPLAQDLNINKTIAIVQILNDISLYILSKSNAFSHFYIP
jgi:hypothetical protein